MGRNRVRGDLGETYVEILVAIVIIGLVGTAILGAVMTSISSSAVHRNLANDDSILKSAVEQAKYEIQNAPAQTSPTLPMFSDCGSGSTTASSLLTSWNSTMTTYNLWPAIPSGIGSYKTWISKVECFTESTSASSLDSTCQASLTTPTGSQSGVSSTGCTNDVSGIIQVTVSVLDQSNLITSLSSLVRNPNFGSYTTTNF